MTPERQNEIWAMLPEDFKKYVQRCYNAVISNLEPTYYVFEDLFGTHNLTAQAEEKPKEPRFKVGDKVLYKGKVKIVQNIITHAWGSPLYELTTLNGQSPLWLWDGELAPYAEPKAENDENSVSSCQNRTNPTENSISDSKNQPESAESVETSTKEDAYFNYRLDLAKEIAVAMIPVYVREYSLSEMGEIAVEVANEIIKRLKEMEA